MINKNGFIAISSVIVIAAVSLSIGITVSLLAIGEGQSSLALVHGEENLHLTESCLEEVLLQSRNSNDYSSGTVTIPEGSCSVVISKSGNNWTATITPTTTDYKRVIQATYTRVATGITLNSWKEI